MSEAFRRIAVTLPFRALVAVFVLYVHLQAVATLAKERFDLDWVTPAGAGAPHYNDPHLDLTVRNWDRFVVSKWDAQHYIELALRGYSECKTLAELKPNENPDDDKRCQLNFFPTYPLVGRYVAYATGWAIDYAMLAVAVMCSFIFMMLWTSAPVTDALGVGMTYFSLLLFNAFTTSVSLVLIMPESMYLMTLMATYWALAERRLFWAAIFAGAATSIRVNGVAVGFAYSAALLMLTIQERPRLTTWALRACYALLSGWGIVLLMAYYHSRFGDALIYIHAHGREYHHGPSVAAILQPNTRVLMQSIWAEPNDGVWLAAGLLWFGLGHRKGLERFDVVAQTYFYVLYAGVVGIAVVGSSEYGYGGLSRYLLGAVPLFFAMAALMRRHPVVLAIWLYMSVAHYWGGNLCFYVGERQPDRLGQCGFARTFANE